MKLTLAVAAALILAPASFAQEVQPWGSRDFSAKRISANSGASPKFVQIDPNEEPYYLTPANNGDGGATIAEVPSADLNEDSSWFWAGVSPEISAGSPERLSQAIGALALAETDLTPDWATMAALVTEFGSTLSEGAQGTRVSPALALAIMMVESSGRKDVVSPAGAKGLMQLMPATAERFGVVDPFTPADNIGGGVAYLDFLLRAFGEDPILSVAAYNSGEGAVAKHGGVPPFAETRDYVPKVLGAWTMARLFCRVPPDRFTDPCAFATLPKG